MVAAADVPDFPAGQELTSYQDLGKAFLARMSSYAGLGMTDAVVTNGVAVIKRDYPEELSVNFDDSDIDKVARLVNERNLPGGSLLNALDLNRKKAEAAGDRDAMVAAAGWCAPSETLYDTCFQGAIDGLIDVPEVQARRGGLRTNPGIDFTGVFGAGTGFFNLSEAQVIAATAKTCIEIPCPTFTDTRLGVTGICLTGNILANRGYPEFVSLWVQAAMVASAHQINQLQIAAMVTGSTAVALTAVDPWASDGSVASQVLSAVEMAIVDIKYRLRMPRSATLEVVLPFWVLAQFRADLARRNGGDYGYNLNVTDAAINSWFATRNARVQWVYDWQDAFATGTVTFPGGSTPNTGAPTSLQFMVYPTGTWLRAVNDVITLNSIYDSTKLATNQLTQLFTETGWAMLKLCTVSRVYTIGICATGATGEQRSIDCVTP
jgi:hypothetical protein